MCFRGVKYMVYSEAFDKMTMYRQIITINRLMIGEWLTQPRAYIAFALGFVFMLAPSMNLYRYAVWMEEPIQLTEAFIVTLSSQHNLAFVMLGLFLLLANAPFLSGRITSILVRVPRKTWLLAQLVYILTSSLMYVLAVALFSMLVSTSYAYIDNSWSNPVYILATNPPSISVTSYSLSFRCMELLENFSPWQAFVICIILLILYGCVLGLQLFVFALSRYRTAGWVIAMGTHLIGFLVLKDAPYHADANWSLLVRAMPAYLLRGFPFPDILNSFSVYIGLILVLAVVCILCAPKIDLCGMSGEER